MEVEINFNKGTTDYQTDLTPTKLPLKEFTDLLCEKIESSLTHVFKVPIKLFDTSESWALTFQKNFASMKAL